MRPIYFLCIAAAMVLLPGASFAEDRYECILRCSAEKDTRNADCPSPYEGSGSSDQRARCMKSSQATYIDCFNRCPPPPFTSGPSSEEPITPPAMGY